MVTGAPDGEPRERAPAPGAAPDGDPVRAGVGDRDGQQVRRNRDARQERHVAESRANARGAERGSRRPGQDVSRNAGSPRGFRVCPPRANATRGLPIAAGGRSRTEAPGGAVPGCRGVISAAKGSRGATAWPRGFVSRCEGKHLFPLAAGRAALRAEGGTAMSERRLRLLAERKRGLAPVSRTTRRRVQPAGSPCAWLAASHSRARRAASRRLVTPSLRSRLLACCLTVASAMASSIAISSLVR